MASRRQGASLHFTLTHVMKSNQWFFKTKVCAQRNARLTLPALKEIEVEWWPFLHLASTATNGWTCKISGAFNVASLEIPTLDGTIDCRDAKGGKEHYPNTNRDGCSVRSLVISRRVDFPASLLPFQMVIKRGILNVLSFSFTIKLKDKR